MPFTHETIDDNVKRIAAKLMLNLLRWIFQKNITKKLPGNWFKIPPDLYNELFL
ncbi:MAG: hypothetical protein MUF15_16065 [Acidobacteria bacterium]|jgi:hypothetical protein|nr:hypothetical protein [Acidobacteriota bacterium]